MEGLNLIRVLNTHPVILAAMPRHYSQPKGFVGRNICYLVTVDEVCYGCTVAGSATQFLPGRNDFLGSNELNRIVNNTFFHVEKYAGFYPLRNFTAKVLERFRDQVQYDWFHRFGDSVLGFESLVELPRTGECYRRDGWSLLGQTKGYTCKRIAGKGTDTWSGRRVWNTTDLRPKHVFARRVA
jgi:hypothetical protein